MLHDRAGAILGANRAMADWLGWSVEELLTMDLGDVLPDGHAGKAFRACEGDLSGGSETFRTKYLTRSGERVEAEVTESVVSLNGQRLILRACRNITESKPGEEAPRRRLEFEQLVAEVSSEFARVAAADVDGSIDRALAAIGRFSGADRAYVFLFREDGRVVDNTHEWCAEGVRPEIDGLSGVAIDEELPWFAERIRTGQTFHAPDVAALPAEAQSEREHFEAQGIQSLIVVPMELGERPLGFLGFDAVRKRRRWTEKERALLRFVGGTIAHVIERKRAEERLRKSERRYRRFFRTSKDAAFITTPGGRWVDMNEAAVELFGYHSREELQQVRVPDLYANPRERVEHLRSIAEKGFSKDYPVKLRRRDGTVIDTLITAVTIKDESGEVVRFQGTIRDVTERKRAARRIRRLNRLLRAICETNQALVQQHDLERLAQRACEKLLETRPYLGCTIALLDADGRSISPVVSAGPECLPDDWSITPHGQGEAPPCVLEALGSGRLCVRRPAEECPKCPHGDQGWSISVVTMPMRHEGRNVGVLQVNMTERERLDQSERDLLEEVAQDLGFAREKILTEKQLRRTKEQYRVLAETSSELAAVGGEEVDPSIDRALASIGGFLEADRAYVALRREQNGLLQVTHEWSAEGIEPRILDLADIPLEEEFPWVARRIHKGRIVDVPDVSSLPPEAESARAACEAGGIRSLIALPLEMQERLMGLLFLCVVGRPRRWTDEERALLRFAANTIAHVLDRKWAGEKLSLRNRAIEASLNGVVITDLEGKIKSANPAALRMWSYSDHSEVVGQKAGRFWKSEQKAREAFRTAKEQGEWSGEMTARRRDGSTLPASASLSTVAGRDGQPTHVVGAFLDITTQKEAEQKLQKALEDLRNAQQQTVEQARQRALTQMASGIAHDFNNFLATIMGCSDLLLQAPELLEEPETVRHHLELVRKAAENAAETVRRMRKFYRPGEEAAFVNLDLNELIAEAVSMTEPRWMEQSRAEGAHIEIQNDLAETARVRGNEAELYELVDNLIFNGVDAMPDGGTLTFRTRQQGDRVILELADTGIGMPEEVMERCFEPFFSTKSETGRGVGLAAVEGIVQRHDGEISVESEQGVGTTFRILLPAAPEPDAQKERPPAPQPRPTSLRVLVAEDDADQREVLTRYLQMDDHKVDTAPEGSKALQMFRAGSYDLVITDRAMRGISGDTLARNIRRQAPGTPVVMLTGFGDMIEAAREKVAGVDLVLPKPITLEKLRDALAEVTAS